MKFLIPLLWILTLIACSPSKFLMVQDSAKPSSLPPGAPRYSDVCFSSRWERPMSPQDTFETFAAAKTFHATWLNWVYTTNPAFIRMADSLGYKVQVALGPTLQDLPFGSNEFKIGRITDKNGNPATAPWMKTWKHWWGCVNHPDFQETYLAYIRRALEAGADAFQVDGPAMGFLLTRNRFEDICYCPFCLEKAKRLHTTSNDIQENSVREFHARMFAAADSIAGRHIPFSSNNFDGDWDLFPSDQFDFGLAELPERRFNPEYIHAALRDARHLGKTQVFSFSSEREWIIQKMIAATYASGGNPLVPWDVWQEGKERYFGKTASFAPLFGFACANAQWLDGYEDAFFASSQDDPRFVEKEKLPVFFEDYQKQLFAYVRAKPGDREAPVVVHVVDWYVLMDSFQLLLNEKRFFKNGIQSIELLTPLPYDRAAHEAAEASGDFSKLVQRETLRMEKNGKQLRLRLPKLTQHWGMLILRGR